MFGIGNNSSNHKPAKTVKLRTGVPINITKPVAPDLLSKLQAVDAELGKAGLDGIQAQVVVVMDHSGSMYDDYRNGTVQAITERFLAFGLTVDADGEVPVIPFDSRVKPAVTVTLENYQDVVKQQIFKENDMGSTDLAAALKEVRKLAEQTDAPLFVAIVTDGEPNDRAEAEHIICDLARYPVFIKFLAVRQVQFLQKLDDLGDDKRLLDNVDAKFYTDIASISDEQFAADMVDEWESWTKAALAAGVLTN